MSTIWFKTGLCVVLKLSRTTLETLRLKYIFPVLYSTTSDLGHGTDGEYRKSILTIVMVARLMMYIVRVLHSCVDSFVVRADYASAFRSFQEPESRCKALVEHF